MNRARNQPCLRVDRQAIGEVGGSVDNVRRRADGLDLDGDGDAGAGDDRAGVDEAEVCDSQWVIIEINVFSDVEIRHKIIGVAEEYDGAAIGADRWIDRVQVSLSGWTDADSLRNAALQVAQEYVG